VFSIEAILRGLQARMTRQLVPRCSADIIGVAVCGSRVLHCKCVDHERPDAVAFVPICTVLVAQADLVNEFGDPGIDHRSCLRL